MDPREITYTKATGRFWPLEIDPFAQAPGDVSG
jgi:hypothetical protein